MRMLTLLATGTALLLSAPAFGQAATSAEATATFMNAEGAEVGTATLTQTAEGVSITGEITGVEPGDHGFHIHKVGDCDASTGFESAGDHFNPQSNQHGLENPEGPHAGDMRNQTAGDDGTVTLDVTTTLVSLNEGDPGYLFDDDGSALVLHAEPDDQMTDPSGNSGDRIACAVIEPAPA